jgi:hypothetical protein
MYPTASSPQYAFGSGLAPVPMPVYKRGGEVKETYGLDNIAEMIRQRGREGDTVLAHISPQEAGILQLLGGSGTINPYTGLPEFKILKKIVPKPIYKLGSAIGKGIERGVEGIAKALGPVGQIAAAYFGGPIGAALYAGLAPPGSSFDVKNAAKAAALTYAGNALSGAENAWAPKFDYGSAFGSGASAGTSLATQQAIDAGIDVVSAPSVSQAVAMSGPGGFEGSYSDAATSYANAPVEGISYPPDPSSYVSGADSAGTYAGTPTVTDATPAPAPTASAPYSADVGEVPGVTSTSGDIPVDTRNVFQKGYSAAEQGVKSLIPEPIQNAYGAVKDFATDLIPPDYREMISTAKDVALIGSGATAAYGAYQTKKELDAAKAEADRILADQANRKKEEIEWAQGVMRDYPYNYQRLTEEEVRRERGMAMGGRITSYDDEMGRDDGMMQGGIAALAKGGLPPRYLRGGGDGMSDSIRASIEGKQEARLADGEFVVPADVVSHLGNGSSNAGAKKLYSMMDRVRKSRTGKTRQAPEVNTRRLMPA